MFFFKRMTRRLNRNRIFYALWIMLAIAFCLTSRMWGEYLPPFVVGYVGDVLWALVLFLIVGFILKRQPIYCVGLIALFFCYGIEFTQSLSIPWLDSLRATTLGALILGKGFLWRDLVCSTLGVLLGIIAEYVTYKLDFMFINKIK